MSIDILRAFTETPKPFDFVLPGLLAGTVGCFVAPKCMTKSMFALELALLVSTGLDCSGFGGGVKRPLGKVAFFSAQDHGDAICQKLHALGKHVGISFWDQFAEQCEIETLSNLDEKNLQKEWLDFVQSLSVGKRLLLLDTTSLSRWFGKDDNARAADFLGALENIARTSGCAIVVLENAERPYNGRRWESSQSDFSGSSPLIENIGWKMYLERTSSNENDQLRAAGHESAYFVRAGVFEQNYGFPSDAIFMKLNADGVLIPAKM